MSLKARRKYSKYYREPIYHALSRFIEDLLPTTNIAHARFSHGSKVEKIAHEQINRQAKGYDAGVIAHEQMNRSVKGSR